ncbi:DUF4165 domain-containing protein [Vibrio sp. SCSIO 43140]|uniref:Ig-like domain-containing protein n=1 Tax=Vibrio sp. SCSIO 43140 TaxID=2819100 RepID=UPI0020762761|nr:Ig-like domain-containing protein [Vibrio sp. SCSIO 43140]USD58838.1 DUF4165 domain-containing protein [Vibrio sp. SCSIO 43140]
MMRYRPIRLSVAMTLSVLSSVSLAGIEGTSFTDTNGSHIERKVSPVGETFFNNQSALKLYISSGLDRRIRVSVNYNQAQTGQMTSHIIGIDDRLTYQNDTFYGVTFDISTPNDGTYELFIETLDLTGTVVATETVVLKRDTQGPVIGELNGYGYGGYEGHTFQPANSWLWSAWNDNYLEYQGITDADSGISKVELETFVMEPTQTLYKTRVLAYSESTQTARFTLSQDRGFLPQGDNAETPFGFRYKVTDVAGNVSYSPIQTIYYDTFAFNPGENVVHAVYDPDSSNVIAGLSGFVPYQSGMTVKTNPIQWLYKIDNNNYSSFALGGLGCVGAKQVILDYNSEGYTYCLYDRSYNYLNGNYVRFNQRATWSVGYLSYNLVLADTAPLSPVNNGSQYRYSDRGWGSWFREVKISELPVRIEAVKRFAEPRSYVQVFKHAGVECQIPIGETECTAEFPRTDAWELTMGEMVYYHSGSSLTNQEGTLVSGPSWADVHTNAKYAPEFRSVTLDEVNKTLAASIHLEPAGSYFDRVRLGKIELHDTTGNLNVSPSCVRQSQDWECVFDLSALGHGVYDLNVYAEARMGMNQRSEGIDYISDKKAPELKWYYEDSETVPNRINDLRSLSFTVTDDSAVSVTELRIESPAYNLDLILGHTVQSVDGQTTAYAIELPRLFPSLEEGQDYVITLVVTDEYGNSTKSELLTEYEPSNLITLDVQPFLDIDRNLETVNGDSLARIYSQNPLVLETGQLATGVQTAEFSVANNATYSLVVGADSGDVVVRPGETKTIQIDLGTEGERLDIHIYPAVANAEAEAQFLFSIPQLRSIYND